MLPYPVELGLQFAVAESGDRLWYLHLVQCEAAVAAAAAAAVAEVRLSYLHLRTMIALLREVAMANAAEVDEVRVLVEEEPVMFVVMNIRPLISEPTDKMLTQMLHPCHD